MCARHIEIDKGERKRERERGGGRERERERRRGKRKGGRGKKVQNTQYQHPICKYCISIPYLFVWIIV